MKTTITITDKTPAELYLELARSKRKLEIGVEKMLQAKEQEIIKCIKSNLKEYIEDYRRNCGINYDEELKQDKAHCWIGENDEFLNLIKEYMELLYD